MHGFHDPEKKQKYYTQLKEAKGDYIEAYENFSRTVFRDDVLSTKQKELIACAIATSKRCIWCLESHLPKAKKAGATKEEIIEAVMVSSIFDGGPAIATTMLEIMPLLEELFN
ncbi:carboxymuconolactone decarboxylase family protein [Mycoplasma zalophi]|uniref:Carboxymuconolactone decarboxylase family protein n=1 Tax=Mycoplasma zalophi TaxID=191287 RepID=A0ABS6DQM4_9MOLU|nr:carboxymuconolactone decarboxylase family protein [Mycoplasma zalophi]MBU4691275.1 carboxymuconolactone decarboxylase family protein [Mycoplasma zalophi]MBU4692519.1 carboxymuconolactone decarboxylase family protein [Mycoplasma zalophi]